MTGSIKALSRIFSPTSLLDWSRREELNTPSTEYNSVALTLSYTGSEAHNPILVLAKIDRKMLRILGVS